MRTATTVRTTVAMIMVGTVTVLAAALGGPWRRSNRGFLLPPVDNTAPTGIPTALPTSRPVDPGDKSDNLLGLGGLLWVLAGVAILATCWLLWTWISARLRLSTPSKPPEGPLGTPAETLPDREVLHQGIVAALELLAQTTDPTDAIISAWLALELAAARSGVAREPAATPTEFTAAVLAATTVDPGAVEELLHLYHRARFSSRGVSHDQLADARSCLQRLSDSWAAFSEVPAPDPTVS